MPTGAQLLTNRAREASPPDAGVYTAAPGQCVVHGTQSGLTLRGSPNAVIDASGSTFGVCVGELGPLSPAGCPRSR
jgi:hypothetical protein